MILCLFLDRHEFDQFSSPPIEVSVLIHAIFFFFFIGIYLEQIQLHQENSCKVFFLYMQAYALRYDSKDDLSTIYRESKNNLKGNIFLAFHRTIYKYIPVYKYTEFRVY